ncbi:hypothetical protein [Polaromonas sp.]|uniref:hypothetical protein n=1 Tax=Polaromonas sp. TaxID=1869339 RepID=UPI0027312010|nr:hypothetical protein [Polaromonas sp.]MDP1886645.1 hypothetical protein [Polaromonas sp.]
MSKTPPKPVEQPSAPVPTHGGVYRVEAGVLKTIAGGPPAAQTPAPAADPVKEGAA